MQTVYIIPGYNERPNSKAYRTIANAFQKKKIKPILITIHWKYASVQDYVIQFLKQFSNSDAPFNLFGFSFGAVIALIASTFLKPKPKKIFLCSLSPFFQEDLKTLKSSGKKALGKRRYQYFSKLSFNKLAKKVTSKTFLFVGDQELPSVQARSRQAQAKIKRSDLIIIRNAKHDVLQREYSEAIVKQLERI